MRPTTIARPLLLLTLAMLALDARAQDPASPAEARLKADVAFLADDAQEGRAPGTKGIEASADYIAEAFQKAGLKPASEADGYFQPFTIKGEPRLSEAPSLAVRGPEGKALEARPKVDFSPLAVGGSGSLEGVPIVFAGYGITAKEANSALDFDDYDGIDARGKVVLILRHAPRQDKEGSPFHGNKAMEYGSFRHKATNAFQRGAKAVLMVNDLAGLKGGKDELLSFAAAGSGGSGIPFLMLSRDFAERLVAAAGLPGLEELEAGFSEGELKPKPRPFEGWTVDGSVKIGRESIATKNVVGVLEGSGPHADETVVVGAHYDHLGHGGLTSGSLAPASNDIHNGADDNASGTALVMELARRLGRRGDPPPRRVVFLAFSGEERGLLGSAHYVARPIFPLKQTVMMLNFDMVGRLDEANDLSVYGTNSTTGLDALVDALGKAEGFSIKKAKGAFGLGDRFSMASDHASFFMKGIPYLFFFTGVHRDYHRPSDDTDLINVAGMARIADFGEVLLLDILRRPDRPDFVKAPARNDHGHAAGAANDPAFANAGRSAYLGTIPDYGGDDETAGGVKLSGVTDGSPAEKGGIKGGDVVVKFDGKPVATLEDYTETLQRHKPGDAVEVVVKREGKEVTLKVTLGTRGDAAK